MARKAKPKRSGKRIVGDGTTALGGDNRTGCAVLVTLAKTLLQHKLSQERNQHELNSYVRRKLCCTTS